MIKRILLFLIAVVLITSGCQISHVGQPIKTSTATVTTPARELVLPTPDFKELRAGTSLLAVIIRAHDSGPASALVAPSGWTLTHSTPVIGANDAMSINTYQHVVSVHEVPSYTWKLDGAQSAAILCGAIGGVGTTGGRLGNTADSSGLTLPILPLTGRANVVLSFFAQDGWGDYETPEGWRPIVQLGKCGLPPNAASFAVFEKSFSSVTATTPVSTSATPAAPLAAAQALVFRGNL
jgi:hypothetical protein